MLKNSRQCVHAWQVSILPQKHSWLMSADHLASRGRPLEASQVYLEYGSNVDAAVDVLCRGMGFAEARRVVRISVLLTTANNIADCQI